ncbi:hypothetical protein AVEN_35546-1 [Araneus ventricosus]|uniref:Uncharacterized protein n=1 Tax=Araneus ventricosus TaxID=182803 RepID=A0A4Y1ZVM7_ARAVE|nr:hypothetical protein AVEN_35546-1 [Araneus ventricosus]
MRAILTNLVVSNHSRWRTTPELASSFDFRTAPMGGRFNATGPMDDGSSVESAEPAYSAKIVNKFLLKLRGFCYPLERSGTAYFGDYTTIFRTFPLNIEFILKRLCAR